MNQSIISILSILIGILSANLAGFITERKFITTTSSIAGVFGTIFIIKLFKVFGLSPSYIIEDQVYNYMSLTIRILAAMVAGASTALIAIKIKVHLNHQ